MPRLQLWVSAIVFRIDQIETNPPAEGPSADIDCRLVRRL
jgi:hypothetical protein